MAESVPTEPVHLRQPLRTPLHARAATCPALLRCFPHACGLSACSCPLCAPCCPLRTLLLPCDVFCDRSLRGAAARIRQQRIQFGAAFVLWTCGGILLDDWCFAFPSWSAICTRCLLAAAAALGVWCLLWSRDDAWTCPSDTPASRVRVALGHDYLFNLNAAVASSPPSSPSPPSRYLLSRP
jgi:hypothetical protein